MRKPVLFIVAAMMIAALVSFNFVDSAGAASYDYNVKVLVNDKQVVFPDQKPFINQDDRTMVPLRFIAEEMGAAVDWEDKTQTVTITREGTVVKLVINQNEALVNGVAKTFDTKAVLVNDRTMVPLRFVSECLGAGVEWAEDTRMVKLTTSTDETQPGDSTTTPGDETTAPDDTTTTPGDETTTPGDETTTPDDTTTTTGDTTTNPGDTTTNPGDSTTTPGAGENPAGNQTALGTVSVPAGHLEGWVASTEMRPLMPGVYVARVLLVQGKTTDSLRATLNGEEMIPLNNKTGFYKEVSTPTATVELYKK